MKEDIMIYFASFEETLQELPPRQGDELRRAIVRFGLYGEEPEFKNAVQRSVWVQLRLVLQSSRDRRTRAQVNGRKGGCPKGTKKPSMVGNRNAAKNSETKPKQNPNESETITIKNKEIKNKEIKNKETTTSSSYSAAVDAAAMRVYHFYPLKSPTGRTVNKRAEDYETIASLLSSGQYTEGALLSAIGAYTKGTDCYLDLKNFLKDIDFYHKLTQQEPKKEEEPQSKRKRKLQQC